MKTRYKLALIAIIASLSLKVSFGAADALLQPSYLADMKETSAKVGFSEFMTSKILKERKMTVCGEIPRHGLYAHAASTVIYDLAGTGASWLKGSVGLEDGQWGKVQFIVFGDDKELWRSPVVMKERREANPKKIRFEVGIRGVKTLKLVVDALGSREHDHSVWVDPQIGK